MPGMHMILDAVGDAHMLDNAQVSRDLLLDVAWIAGMTVVAGPNIHSFKHPGNPGAGLSCHATIAESHIEIHTWPATGQFSFEIYSCKSFNAAAVDTYVRQRLRVTVVEQYMCFDRPGRPSALEPETFEDVLKKAA